MGDLGAGFDPLNALSRNFQLKGLTDCIRDMRMVEHHQNQ